MAIVRDGNFSMVESNIINTNNIITGNLTVNGSCTGNISTTVSDDSLFIHKLKHDLFTVPYYFGQRLNFSDSVTNMRINVTFMNRYDISITFKNDIEDIMQVWLIYYNSAGNILSNGMSTAFFPETTNIDIAPLARTVGSQDPYEYGITLNNLHFNKPDAATSWAVFIRPISETYGTMSIGQYVQIQTLGITTW